MPAAPAEKNSNFEVAIRVRAYQIYEARGKQDGHDWCDWYRAESELNSARREAHKNEDTASRLAVLYEMLTDGR